MTPDEINKLSDAHLLVIINSHNYSNPDYDLAVKEYYRRQEIKEKENKDQMSTSVRWSMIAGVAAIGSIVLMIVQILISIHQGDTSKQHDESPTQSTMQNIQQPTKNTKIQFLHTLYTGQRNQMSSSTASTYTTPSLKRN